MKPYNLRTKGALKCAHCGKWFTSLRFWQAHRLGPYDDRFCLDEAELRLFGFRKDTKGRWKLVAKGEYDYNRRGQHPSP